MTNRFSTPPVADVEVVIRGDIPNGVRERADEMITDLSRLSRDPILHARVRLTRSANPAMRHPVLAQANLDVNGRPVRGQVAAPTAREALDALAELLRQRIGEVVPNWQARRGSVPRDEPHEWRHTSEPTQRPDYYPRPESEREVVRHKAFELAQATPDEAIMDLDLMGYAFQLFTDLDTGQDSVIYRAEPDGYEMAQVRPRPGWVPGAAAPVRVAERPAPTLDLIEAIDRLNLSGDDFLFFADRETGRGHVLYRRYDGHYGLVAPAG